MIRTRHRISPSAGAMLTFAWLLLLFFSLIAAPVSADQEKMPPLIPREVLFGNPTKTAPQVSPDGKMLAYLAPEKNVLNVWVKTIGRDDDRVVTHDEKRGIRIFFWAFDNRHILYLQDVGGNENWNLFGVDLKTGDIKSYTPFKDVQVRILALDKHYPDILIISMNKRNAKFHDVYRVDLNSGDLSMIAENPGTVGDWLIDADLKVRGATVPTKGGGEDFLVRDRETAPWKTLVSWDNEDALTSDPLLFSKDGRHVYMRDSRNANTSRLVSIDGATGKIEVLAEDPVYDVSHVMTHPDTKEIQAVVFMKERKEWNVVDQAIEGDIKTLSKLESGDLFVSSRDMNDTTWITGFNNDAGPVSFYAYDRNTRKATFLFHHKPELKDYTLAPMEPISFTARDGLAIHGYITSPPGKKGEKLPMVLNVHGGPWWRNSWGFDPEAQWFANRGYICLQVNFRGSTGYGKDFINAGDREWAAKMHNDLIDAVRWAVEKGYADPQKIAIYGGSYGGYAALVGATFTPDQFCCAVDIVGPSNLITLLKSIPPYWESMLEIFRRRVGNPDTEQEFLKSRSPLFKVDDIKIPVLIAQGANDPRVKKAEADQIVEAMKKKGLPYEYLVFDDEGHGFARPENRMIFYRAAEKFLAKHLGGRYEE